MKYTYTVRTAPNGDTIPIRNDPNTGLPDDPFATTVQWADPDFQAWNQAQQTPAVLSTEQALMQQAKAMTFAQFQAWYEGPATAQQKERLLYILIKRALNTEIV